MQKVSLQANLAGDTSDAACTQQPPEARPLISPTTLGVVVREGMVGSLPPPARKQRKRLDKKGPKGARAPSSNHPPLKPREVDRIPVEGAELFHIVDHPLYAREKSARAHTEQ